MDTPPENAFWAKVRGPWKWPVVGLFWLILLLKAILVNRAIVSLEAPVNAWWIIGPTFLIGVVVTWFFLRGGEQTL